MGNLAKRFLVAAVAVPIIVYVIYQPRHWVLWGLVYAVSLLAMAEFFAMTLKDRTDQRISLLLGAVAGALFYWVPRDFPLSPALIAVVVTLLPVMLYYLFRFGDIETVASRVGFTGMGVIYAGLAPAFIAFVKRDFGEVGPAMVILILATAWLADTGGYFAGKYLGKKKLYPAVSPNKTWAGAIGGVCGSAVAGVGVKLGLLPSDAPWLDIMAMAIFGSMLGQMGDLCESLIKRSVGVKDSGALLPGHGGILDRIDAVLFIAPFVYVYGFVRAAL